MSDERVRLFVALELPGEVRDALAAWGSRLGLPGVRVLAADQLHVTLCFLGWQPASDVGRVARACEQLDRRGPAALALGEALWLPPRRPRVLAVQLHDRDRRLAAVQSALSQNLHTGGWYEPEHRPYLPHVTVARVGRRARVRPSPPSSPPPLSFTAAQVTLFRSRLSAAGARYEALASVALG